jgi:hypothetical protein
MSEVFPRSLVAEDLGKRVLVKTTYPCSSNIYHTWVAEFSPSGRYVCLDGPEADTVSLGWKEVAHVEVLEVLPGSAEK